MMFPSKVGTSSLGNLTLLLLTQDGGGWLLPWRRHLMLRHKSNSIWFSADSLSDKPSSSLSSNRELLDMHLRSDLKSVSCSWYWCKRQLSIADSGLTTLTMLATVFALFWDDWIASSNVAAKWTRWPTKKLVPQKQVAASGLINWRFGHCAHQGLFVLRPTTLPQWGQQCRNGMTWSQCLTH